MTKSFDPDNNLPRWLDRWCLLILREISLGNNRFDGLVKATNIARNILSMRLGILVEEGLVSKQQYSQRPARHEYVLTPAGHDALLILSAVYHWMAKHNGHMAQRMPNRVLSSSCKCSDPHVMCLHCFGPFECA